MRCSFENKHFPKEYHRYNPLGELPGIPSIRFLKHLLSFKAEGELGPIPADFEQKIGSSLD